MPQYPNSPSVTPQLRRAIDPVRLRERMVRELALKGIQDAAVLQALRAVPRHLFVPEALRSQAYEDTALPIGQGQTISQPYTVALMTSMLEVQAGMRVLEIGTGSGYQAAVLDAMRCRVFSIERLPELFEKTRRVLQAMGIRSVHLMRGDGTMGMSAAAPFDRIIVTAGGPEVPAPLVAQLDNNGIMLIPVGEKKRTQRLLRIRKENGRVFQEDLGNAVFVDLVGNHGW